ncbi:MAG: hypothetical protein UU95_C0024G0026 [Parcubacteria group bacterium GW2011_GWC2_42_12]|uniref:Uncharacterized protein n=1 Tax=Candidatus Falkowbacteria bacterium RIFCSPHIGHO2_02_FULL_42_9 TaxID=1797986 RepID=A0A1F5SAC6_9BACT|nr:MAG: hypothetical protein UU95_C0024G0026 [Parcubacteria group bacterium GW2011_GWC2_42_12]OGF23413.1 MAG: hypothetical protein A3D45_01935 [Candidatus Falkowbacteria bacterium RIFCSPHIGHO2_02_FULL_42_9]
MIRPERIILYFEVKDIEIICHCEPPLYSRRRGNLWLKTPYQSKDKSLQTEFSLLIKAFLYICFSF